MKQCAWCGREFRRNSSRGRPPLYCSPVCRQRAYEARRDLREALELGRAWNDLHRSFESIRDLQRQIGALRPGIDVSKVLPKMNLPKFMTEDTVRQLSGAASMSKAFEKMNAFAGIQKQLSEALRPGIDVSKVLPTVRLPMTFSDEVLAELVNAGRRLEAVLPEGRPEADDVPSEVNTETGTDAEVAYYTSLLLLACIAIVTYAGRELAELLVWLLQRFMETGSFVGNATVKGYSEISDALPNDNALTWSITLAAVLRSLRLRKPQQVSNKDRPPDSSTERSD